MKYIKDLNQNRIEYYANEYLKDKDKEKEKNNYLLSSIEEDLIACLEDEKESILENDGDFLHEYVDSSLSVYTYDQIMIFAHNSDLWSMADGLGGETVQEQIVGVIYEHLSGVAYTWLHEKQEEEIKKALINKAESQGANKEVLEKKLEVMIL